MRSRVVEDCRSTWPVHELCRVFGISPAGYYAWRSRPESRRAAEDRALLGDIRQAHESRGGRYGSRYAFALPDAVARRELRPLRNPASAGSDGDEPTHT